MRWRTAAIAAVLALVVAGALAMRSGWFRARIPLTIHLRCAIAGTGRVSVATIGESGEPHGEKSFDLTAACRDGRIEVAGYQSADAVRITVDRGNNNRATVTAEYGSDIQRDQEGFFTVVRIMNESPFVAKDRI